MVFLERLQKIYFNNYPMKTALVFGITGQDGSFLADLLLKKGYKVIGVTRDAQRGFFPNLKQLGIKDKIKFDSASINDFRSVLQIVAKYEPNEIYNLAGQSSVALSFEQPVETFESISVANLNLLEVIRFLNIPIKYFNAGSGDCFGNTNGKAVNESDAFRPCSPYGVAKAAACWQGTTYREAYNIFECTGILFNHESYLRSERFVTRKIVKTACRIANGSDEKLLLGNISIERDWGWAPEYVEAMWVMLQQEDPDDYIIATGETYSLKDFIAAVFQALNLDWHDYVRSSKGLMRPTDIQTIRADPGKAARVLGWTATYNTKDVARLMVNAELESSGGGEP